VFLLSACGSPKDSVGESSTDPVEPEEKTEVPEDVEDTKSEESDEEIVDALKIDC